MKLLSCLILQKGLHTISLMMKILSFLLIETDVINKEKEVHEGKLKSRHLLLCTALSQAPLGHTHNDFLLLRALDCMPRNSGGDYQVFTVLGTGTCMQQRCHLFLPQIHWNQNVLGINVVELKQEERKHGEIVFLACVLICLHVQWWVICLCSMGSVYVSLASVLVVLCIFKIRSSRK